MDAVSWRTISQLAIFSGSLVAGFGGVGVWYFGRQIDTGKDLKADADREQLSQQLTTLQRGNDDLQRGNSALFNRLEPFEQLARQRFPTAPADEAMERLRTELTEVENVATRDIPRPRKLSIHDQVVANLKTLSDRPQLLGLHLHNTNSRNVVELVLELQAILKDGGIQYLVLTETGMSGINPAPPPYSVMFSPSAAAAASQLGDALTPFLGAPGQSTVAPNLPAGRVDITIAGQPDFNADGSVTIR